MSDPKLLNCPFCGGPAGFEKMPHNATGFQTWSVGCQNEQEDCIAYQMLAHYARKAEAAEAWNKRAQPGVGVTPELVRLVKQDKCQSCGAYSYEDCGRHPQRDCFREFNGGSRNVDAPAV